ncbi:MAG: hypothetical protein LiPW41_177 [Parcubacteria group bacterium LiPW_41]|nr:MAG: hypothetical protein LiPW41_177 [Parcubacteria group bacterium LiPW_41]
MKLLQTIKHCVNLKVLIGIGIIVLFIYLFIPNVASLSWLLFVLICPLSMVFMLKVMDHDHGEQERVFICPECGTLYKDRESAKQCSVRCKGNHGRNSEIIKYQNN